MFVSATRRCSRTACPRPAAATLTYVQADSTVVIGPLASRAEPGAHDLCRDHAERFTPPLSWHVIRLGAGEAPPQRSRDDLLAIADAVREAARPAPAPPEQPPASPGTGTRRGHLRVLPTGGEE
ncbi:DUF3499 domain-containing protein [Sediminivirga luteola]|uniref:DUF3499 domain-containing protein n=1 Tax=Sediminivirga luteola TaxID=1774748 RepID=A0A8J2XLI4_9MICO|nr:hypothetical protein GCM10011333_21900 [Sediminivirga luteola]